MDLRLYGLMYHHMEKLDQKIGSSQYQNKDLGLLKSYISGCKMELASRIEVLKEALLPDLDKIKMNTSFFEEEIHKLNIKLNWVMVLLVLQTFILGLIHAWS